jgi:hypothetical protein
VITQLLSMRFQFGWQILDELHQERLSFSFSVWKRLVQLFRAYQSRSICLASICCRILLTIFVLLGSDLALSLSCCQSIFSLGMFIIDTSHDCLSVSNTSLFYEWLRLYRFMHMQYYIIETKQQSYTKRVWIGMTFS